MDLQEAINKCLAELPGLRAVRPLTLHQMAASSQKSQALLCSKVTPLHVDEGCFIRRNEKREEEGEGEGDDDDER